MDMNNFSVEVNMQVHLSCLSTYIIYWKGEC